MSVRKFHIQYLFILFLLISQFSLSKPVSRENALKVAGTFVAYHSNYRDLTLDKKAMLHIEYRPLSQPISSII